MCNQTLVINRINECYRIASKHFNYDFTIPSVKFKKRGQCAGTANSYTNVLNFNMILLNENVEHFVKHTVAHEVAHLVTYHMYNVLSRQMTSAHGRHWKSVMDVLGVPATRCHDYNVDNARIKRKNSFDYKCEGCNNMLTLGKIRHAKQQSGQARYHHGGCNKANLVYIPKI